MQTREKRVKVTTGGDEKLKETSRWMDVSEKRMKPRLVYCFPNLYRSLNQPCLCFKGRADAVGGFQEAGSDDCRADVTSALLVHVSAPEAEAAARCRSL